MKPGDIVWIVEWRHYDDSRILGLFTSKAEAEEFLNQLREHKVNEWVDSEVTGMPVESLAQAAARIRPFDHRRWDGTVQQVFTVDYPPEVE